MPKYWINLNSADRVSNSVSTSDCIFNLDEGVKGIQKASLRSFVVPNVIYNINTGVNDRMVWNRLAIDRNFQIPAGQYTITNLLTAIENGMNAADANGYTLDYDTTTFKCTVAGTATFILNWATNANASTSCYKELGFNATDVATAISHVSPNVASLDKPRDLFIDIFEFGSRWLVSKPPRVHATFHIPLDVASGDLVFYDRDVYDQHITFDRLSIKSLNVKIVNDDANVISLNGADWSMILELDLVE